MFRVPASSWLWKNDLYTDVFLHLRTSCAVRNDTASASDAPAQVAASPATTAGHGLTKTARRDGCDTSAAEVARQDDVPTDMPLDGVLDPSWAPGGRTFRLHALVLASCSQYFRTRLANLMGRRNSSCSGGALRYDDSPEMQGADACNTAVLPRSACCRLVEHVEECELDAMEALLRYCYTNQLNELAGHAKPSCEELLRMVVLADRYGVQSRLTECCEELATRSPQDFSIAAINLALAAPSSVQNMLTFAIATETATQRLLQVFGDADMVCGSWYDTASDLGHQLLQLSHAAILFLVSSDKLVSMSENSVLLMADAWAMHVDAHAPRNMAQLRELAEALRLGQLTHNFIFDVMPTFGWLQLTL